MLLPVKDWELEDFAEGTLVDHVEIRVSHDSTRALVLWPWHTPPGGDHPALITVRNMGFEDMTEFGNILGYMIYGEDTDDSDYIILEPR